MSIFDSSRRAHAGRVALVATALGLLSACASVDPEPAFRDVAGRIQATTGQEPQWIRTDEQKEEIEKAKDAMLLEPLDATAAVRLALIGNPSLQAEFEELGISQAELAQATRIANPDAHASVRFVEGGPGEQVELGLAMDVLSIVLQPARKKLATLQLEQTKARVAGEVVGLIADVKEAHATLVARQQLLGRLRVILELGEAAAEFAERQFEAGTLSEIDLRQQQLLRIEAQADVALHDAHVRADRERLNRLLGLSGARTAWSVPDALPPLPGEDLPLDGLEQAALLRRSDLQVARLEVDVIGRALSLKKKTRFFPIGVNLGVSTEKEPGEGGPVGGRGTRLTGPTLGLQLPIFDAGGASVAKLEAQHRQARRRLEAAEIRARSEVRETHGRLLATRQLADYYARVVVPARARILELGVGYFNMMLKGAYELMLAKQAGVQAEKAGVEAWRDYWIARAQLEKTLGGALAPGATGPPEDKPRTESFQ